MFHRPQHVVKSVKVEFTHRSPEPFPSVSWVTKTDPGVRHLSTKCSIQKTIEKLVYSYELKLMQRFLHRLDIVQVPSLVLLDYGCPLEPMLPKLEVNFCYVELGLSEET